MRRLLCARYVLVVGAHEAIPAWFQHAVVREKSTRDTPKRAYRFGSFATTVGRLSGSIFVDNEVTVS
jgi:hypothetical protein